jgi:Zn-dependent protease with chaperone function
MAMDQNVAAFSCRYFDGQRPVPQAARLARHARGLTILRDGGLPPVFWPYVETRLERHGAEAHLHRVQGDADTGERISLAQGDLQSLLGPAMAQLSTGRAGEASGRRIVVWSVAAIASLVFLFFVGLPLFARFAAPLVPWSWEVSLGRSIEPQIIEFLAERTGSKLRVCGADNPAGKAALDSMVEKLAAGARLPGPLRVDVIDTPMVNAFALPGGRIYLFRPILDKAEGPDEVAGVLAHEIGHVVHRDAMRALVHGGALSLAIGMVLGDVTGGSTLAILGKILVGQAYSRENEAEADRVSVDLMDKAGADPRAINQFFRRITPFGQPRERSITDLLAGHPVTQDRMAAVDALAAERQGRERRPILDRAGWQALKTICNPRP